jgi:hypothetical protein
VLDRLLHHAVVVQVEGASYRLRQHAELVPEHIRSKALIHPPPITTTSRISAQAPVSRDLVEPSSIPADREHRSGDDEHVRE